MKCLSFFLLCGFLSPVASVLLSVDPTQPLVGQSSTVTWTREPSDPDDLNFDLRFVQDGSKDVGLALANIYPADDEDSGTVAVMFPSAGKYTLVAVTG
ncbi:hypothetical protein CPB83DRAFT_538822 [Crepidotus variabilis]|uniref:Uncharacterized protein n=1 Tax=Crepidotus variabilis TaxID=179855 RepID=A0A9P6JUA7_9AGAR|nr:hypothetical protein CPB83DRAFT_538822 [Crepidotus variabilis]